MLIPQVIGVLQEKCKEAGQGGLVQVELPTLRACMEGLADNASLQQQIDQLQEQMSMKPSVARKLAEKIKKLEDELEITRDASRVKELERKVQKLELDLKQSYSTKNFTLKQGLLDLEKKYRAHIYGHPDVQDLWHEVTLMLMDEKEKAAADLAGLLPSSSLLRSQAGRRTMPRVDSAGLLGGGSQAGESTPDRPYLHSAMGSGMVQLGMDNVAQGNVQRTVERIHEVHGRDAPLALHYPGHMLATGSSPAMYTAWSHMATDDAAQKAELVLASLASLREKFGGAGLPGLPPGEGQQRSSGAAAAEGATVDASSFDQQVDTLAASIQHLLALWSTATATDAPASQYPPGASRLGMPPLPGMGPGNPLLTATDGAEAELKHLLSHPNSLLSHAQQPSVRDLISYFLSFLQSNGMYMSSGLSSGTRHRGAGRADGDVSEGGTPTATPIPVSDIIQQFTAHLRRAGLTGAAAALMAQGAGGAEGPQGAERGAHPAGYPAAADMPNWLPLLPALRLSTAAAAGGASGASARALMDAAVAAGTAPSWWAPSLEAAGVAGNSAVVKPTSRSATTTAGTQQGYAVGEVGSAADATGMQEGAFSTATSTAAAAAAGMQLAQMAGQTSGSAGPAGLQEEAAAGMSTASTPTAGSRTAVSTGEAFLEGTLQEHTLDPELTEAGASPMTPAAKRGGSALSSAAGNNAVALPAVAFNPLLLPGPARTMQAVMAHVRHKHAAFLTSCPEAEVLLSEALAAASELQAAQDCSLIMMAVNKRSSQPPTSHATPISRLSPSTSATASMPLVADGSMQHMPTQLSFSRGGTSDVSAAPGMDGTAYRADSSIHDGGHASFEFPGGPGTNGTMHDSPQAGTPGISGVASGGPQARASHQQEIQPADDHQELGEEADGSGGAGAPQVIMVPAELTLEDYAAELDEVRAIASRHAEHAAVLQELLARIATQHASAAERADDLEMRVALGDKESALLRSEVNSLTRLLVDVKMAYAERDEEAQRLAQRLKRSLQGENTARDEVEELRRKLAVVGGEDLVTMDSDYTDMMQAAMGTVSGDAASHAAPAAASRDSGLTGNQGQSGGGGGGGGHAQLRVRTSIDHSLPPTPPTHSSGVQATTSTPGAVQGTAVAADGVQIMAEAHDDEEEQVEAQVRVQSHELGDDNDSEHDEQDGGRAAGGLNNNRA